MARVMFFIDGFNVYHSIKENPKYHKFLWLNFWALGERFTRKVDTLTGVKYFSAHAFWRQDAVKRHQLLIDALKTSGVDIILGKFKEKDRHCKRCNRMFKINEEKQTDVNIAISLFKEAHLDNYDTAILVTNDTDLIPAIKAVKDTFPNKRVGVLFPIDRWSSELKSVCHFWRKIEGKDLSKSQFPDPVVLPSGIKLSKPPSWI